MDNFMDKLHGQDERIVSIFRKEEIDDLDTFLQLDDNDFTRLKLTTKMIKIIQRVQREYDQAGHTTTSASCSTTTQLSSSATDPNDNPYQEINLDEIINIDRVFEKTEEGIAVMEALKETTKPNETIIRKVGNILCDCLKSLYGCRPCNFYKNQIAVSLVQSYPITAAESTETPQALWFHPHARGTNRHAGRIHYRMEYLSRKSEERVTKRRRIADQGEDVQLISPAAPEDIDKAESELKFIIPNSQMKSRVIELWNATFKMRH
ncbi:uncharacterized protein LOC135696960 [Ochlerotatus camptorhynchus]|uniref:uncharacterized protein LOC135696960 n=1 Tax=Ochlerotatus camptorhynchus TaxID=644619 RepID=UPI0031D2B93E